MTRENLIQAIYENTEDWSCQEPCMHIMEEKDPSIVCRKCAEKQLAEYEAKVRADATNKFVVNAIKEFQKFDKEHGYPTLADISVILSEIAEQLKEKK